MNAKTRKIDFYEVDGYHKEVRFSQLAKAGGRFAGTYHFHGN